MYKEEQWNLDSWSFLLFEVLPHGSAGKESASNAGDLGSIPELGGFPEEGNGCLF